MPVQIALSGYYGCGNMGDEAVLAGIKTAFDSYAADRAQLTVLSQDPERTVASHNLPAVQRMDLRAVRALLRRSDLLISGGGSLLQDTTSFKSLVYYVHICEMARRAGKPYMFYAQGIGPLRRPISRWLVRRCAEKAAAITVRDKDSAQLLSEIGVRSPVEVTADPAFALNPILPVNMAQRVVGLSDAFARPTIGFFLRPWLGDRATEAAAHSRTIDSLLQSGDYDALLVPMQHPGDLEFAREIAAGVRGRCGIVATPLVPEEMLGWVGKLHAVVAMRLHALIFAAKMAVPCFALSYDPKVASLMAGLGMSQQCVPCTEVDAGRLKEFLIHHDAISAALAAGAPDREIAARRNVELAMRCVR